MATETIKAKKRQQSPIDRFVGSEGRVVNKKQQSINNYIQAEWLDVCLPDDSRPEDAGMLYLYPIADGQFCLQMFFLQYESGPAMDATIVSLQFLPAFFDQYPPEALMANQPFRFDQTTEQQFSVCAQIRTLLTQLQQGASLPPFIKSLQQSEAATHILRRALECITIPFTTCQVPACRFLAYESEREKIKDARQILEGSIDHLLTIKDLARMVAMNECYLKKGFKALVGRTIHEFQQELRINKAKELLQEHGRTVTEIANTLGYSSISHFSTAFKRVTGMKPCELLA